MRRVLTAEEIAKLIAAELGIDPEDMSYMWQVADDGAFEGVVILK